MKSRQSELWVDCLVVSCNFPVTLSLPWKCLCRNSFLRVQNQASAVAVFTDNHPLPLAVAWNEQRETPVTEHGRKSAESEVVFHCKAKQTDKCWSINTHNISPLMLYIKSAQLNKNIYLALDRCHIWLFTHRFMWIISVCGSGPNYTVILKYDHLLKLPGNFTKNMASH